MNQTTFAGQRPPSPLPASPTPPLPRPPCLSVTQHLFPSHLSSSLLSFLHPFTLCLVRLSGFVTPSEDCLAPVELNWDLFLLFLVFVCRLRGGGEGHVMENKSVQVCVCVWVYTEWLCAQSRLLFVWVSLCVFSCLLCDCVLTCLYVCMGVYMCMCSDVCATCLNLEISLRMSPATSEWQIFHRRCE